MLTLLNMDELPTTEFKRVKPKFFHIVAKNVLKCLPRLQDDHFPFYMVNILFCCDAGDVAVNVAKTPTSNRE